MKGPHKPSNKVELGIEISELCEAANENGVPREDIVRVLERHVDWAESDRADLDGFEDIPHPQ